MVRKGDMTGIWEKCAYIVENDYSTQRVDHAYIEPEAAVAYLDINGVMNVLNSTQYPFRDRSHRSSICLEIWCMSSSRSLAAASAAKTI